MIQTTAEFFAAAQPFVGDFDEWVATYRPEAKADHICYKCGDSLEFEVLRGYFEKESVFVYQSIISQRRIAIIKFVTPIKTTLGDIWFLELSDQKPDGSQTSGFDHIEIYPNERSIETLAEQLTARGMKLEKVGRAHHTTIDGFIKDAFKIRLEDGPLIEKIKATEIV